jgi:hypothetical protein
MDCWRVQEGQFTGTGRGRYFIAGLWGSIAREFSLCFQFFSHGIAGALGLYLPFIRMINISLWGK